MPRKPSMIRALSHLLEASGAPIYALNDSRQVVFCNRAAADWVGVAADQLAHLTCTYQGDAADDAVQRIADGLCPPPEAFAGQRMDGVLSFTDAAGKLVRRRVLFAPLSECDVEHVGVLAIVGEQEIALHDALQDEMNSDSQRLRAMLAAVRHSLGKRFSLTQLIGDTPAMKRVRDQVHLAIQTRTRVLVIGPPGSGREHAARAIYYGSEANLERPLVPLSCSLLDAELLQTTIASFRADVPDVELQPGALMLLDVDELSPAAQVALMGVLDIPEFQLGIISTSRQPLDSLVEQDRFREDLANTLSTIEINLPPLDSRRDDIPLLCQAVLEEYNSNSQRTLSGFTPEALDQLCWHEFKENVDSLREIVLDACEMAAGPRVTSADLPMEIRLAAIQAAHPKREPQPIKLDEFLEEMEAEVIRRALAQTRGNRAQAARLLEISRPRLLRRMAHFGIE